MRTLARITDFYGRNVKSCGLKNPLPHSGNYPEILVTYINNLVKRFNIDVTSRDGNEEKL